MASLSDIVNVTVSTLTAAIKAPGFGIPLIADFHTKNADIVRHYSDPDDLIADGFAVTDSAYKAVAAAFAQDPQLNEIALGRRALAPQIAIDVAVSLQNDKKYILTITKPDGTIGTAEYDSTHDLSLPFTAQSANFSVGDVVTGTTSAAHGILVSQTDAGTTGTLRLTSVVGTFQAAETITSNTSGSATTGTPAAYETVGTIVAGLVTACNALSGITATDLSGAHTTVHVVSSVTNAYIAASVNDKALMAAKQTHADPGIATDLAAFALNDPTWYGLTLTTQGKAEIIAAAQYTEANAKLMLQASQDGDIIVSGSGDVASTLKTDNLFRTGLIFCSDPTAHAGAAWFGKGFPIDPGGLTFANLTLAGVPTEALTGTNITQLKAKNCNYMTSYGSSVLTRNGVTAAGEFIDIIRDRDWYNAQLQSECLAVIVNNRKVPFTDRGIAMLESAVRTATKRAIDAGFLAEGSDKYVVPKASDVSANDRANRTLGNTPIQVSAQVQGAIHVVVIRATVTA